MLIDSLLLVDILSPDPLPSENSKNILEACILNKCMYSLGFMLFVKSKKRIGNDFKSSSRILSLIPQKVDHQIVSLHFMKTLFVLFQSVIGQQNAQTGKRIT